MQSITTRSLYNQFEIQKTSQQPQSIETFQASEKKAVITKLAQNGKSVEFYYDNKEGVQIRIDGQYIKQHYFPSNLKSISSQEALIKYLEHSYICLSDLSDGDKRIAVSQRILGGGQELKQPGHGLTYIVLRKGENINNIRLKLTDNEGNTIAFNVDQDKATLRYQNTTFNSMQAIDPADPKRIMGRLCLENHLLVSDQKYWLSVDSNNGKVSCGFGEVSDATTLHTMEIDKAKLQNIKRAKFSAEDSLGNDLKKTETRLVIEGLRKGGAVIVNDGKLNVGDHEIKTVNLPEPVKHLMTEMTAVEKEIESKYGQDIWDKIQNSLDNGILKTMVEEKKASIRQNRGPIKVNQAYVRIGFGDNYKGGPGHRMVIELWPAGHESPVHQHSSSYSYIKVMKGEVININYPILSDCAIGETEISKGSLREGDRTWLSPNQNQIHKIENKTNKGVISFHGYRYGEVGNQELTGVFDLIDKDGKYKEGGAVISHWDTFAAAQGYPVGIEGFLKTISEAENPISTGLNIEGTCANNECILYQKKSIHQVGKGHYELGQVVYDALCANCTKPLDNPDKITLKDCHYKIITKTKNRATETIEKISEGIETLDITNWFSASISIQ